jgi:hypothetical protein
MKRNINLLFLLLAILILNNCSTPEKTSEVVEYKNLLPGQSPIQMLISVEKGKSFNHPTFVIWEEDMEGNYTKTIFITKSYASGIFDHKLVGDSIWFKEEGQSYQPAALPYWTYKKGKINDKTYVPTPEHPFVDGYSGATPDQDFKYQTNANNRDGQYRVLLEVNQSWDWNKYWTNNKYPESAAYKHAAQPSIIYAVTINKEQNTFFLNPIGHGDPTGESGKIYTDLSTLTTTKEIFSSIKIEIIKSNI